MLDTRSKRNAPIFFLISLGMFLSYGLAVGGVMLYLLQGG